MAWHSLPEAYQLFRHPCLLVWLLVTKSEQFLPRMLAYSPIQVRGDVGIFPSSIAIPPPGLTGRYIQTAKCSLPRLDPVEAGAGRGANRRCKEKPPRHRVWCVSWAESGCGSLWQSDHHGTLVPQQRSDALVKEHRLSLFPGLPFRNRLRHPAASSVKPRHPVLLPFSRKRY